MIEFPIEARERLSEYLFTPGPVGLLKRLTKNP